MAKKDTKFVQSPGEYEIAETNAARELAGMRPLNKKEEQQIREKAQREFDTPPTDPFAAWKERSGPPKPSTTSRQLAEEIFPAVKTAKSKETDYPFIGTGEVARPLVLSPKTLGFPSEIEKQEPTNELAPALGGGQPSAPEQSLKQKVVTGQEKLKAPKTKESPASTKAASVASAQDTSESLEDKLRSGKAISRGDLLSVLDELKKVEIASPEISEADKNNFIQARARAYQAYKEKADRNEWLDVAQNLTNALATYAAGRGGSAYRGLSLPTTDYGARTAQAMREYETALGTTAEQERALERDIERRGKQATQAAELKRRGLEDVLKLGESAISAQEREAAQKRDIATKLEIAAAKKEAYDARRDLKREEDAKKAAEGSRSKQMSFLKTDIDNTNLLLKQAEDSFAAANNMAAAESSKEFDKAFTKFLSETGQTQAEFEKAGWFGTSVDKEAVREAAAKRAAQLQSRINDLKQRQQDSIMKQQALLEGVSPVSPTPPAPAKEIPAPTNYQPGDVIEQSGKRYRFKGGNASDPANYEEVR